jgi:hypothetical protein
MNFALYDSTAVFLREGDYDAESCMPPPNGCRCAAAPKETTCKPPTPALFLKEDTLSERRAKAQDAGKNARKGCRSPTAS